MNKVHIDQEVFIFFYAMMWTNKGGALGHPIVSILTPKHIIHDLYEFNCLN